MSKIIANQYIGSFDYIRPVLLLMLWSCYRQYTRSRLHLHEVTSDDASVAAVLIARSSPCFVLLFTDVDAIGWRLIPFNLTVADAVCLTLAH